MYKLQSTSSFYINFTHVGDIENTHRFADMQVFGHHAFILHGHVESGEFYHFRAQLFVFFCKNCILHIA